MHKYLMGIGFAVLSFSPMAAKMTLIKTTPELKGPVHVAIFRGFCSNLKISSLQTPADFASLGSGACQYVTDDTLSPDNPKKIMKAWHQGSATLTLVAFQDKSIPVQCPIDDSYKLIFVRPGEGNGELVCTSPEVGDDPAEAEEVHTEEESPIASPNNTELKQEVDADSKQEPAVEDPTDSLSNTESKQEVETDSKQEPTVEDPTDFPSNTDAKQEVETDSKQEAEASPKSITDVSSKGESE